MYTANGITTEFPLPEGADGSAVYLVSPGGDAVKMKQGDAYTIRDGTVVFSTPPPKYWPVIFELDEEEGEAVAKKGVCTIIYPDGSTKELDRDPWELLVETRTVLAEAKAVHAEAWEATAKAVAEIKALAAAAAGDIEGRLLGYSARAEDAIKAAAGGAAGALSEKLAEQIRETREARTETRKTLEGVREIAAEMSQDMKTACAEKLEAADRKAEEYLEKWRSESARIIDAEWGVLKEIEALAKSTKEDIAVGKAQADGRVTFLLQEETRIKTELQAAIDEAKQNFPAVRHGNRGDIIRQRRDATREGDAVV
jgi:hypothetical protein